MYCTKCGTQIPEEVKFCPACGQSAEAPAASAAPAKKNGSKVIIIVVAIVVALAIIGGIVGGVMAIAKKRAINELSDKLTTIDWSRVEQGDSDTYYTLRLDFDGKEIEYDFDSYYIDQNIAVYDYEVISGDEIRIDGYKIIKIDFSDDMFVMTMTPALTSVDSAEFWYNHEN